jgi:hypothetical protein
MSFICAETRLHRHFGVIWRYELQARFVSADFTISVYSAPKNSLELWPKSPLVNSAQAFADKRFREVF